jgi:hypothetical protein
MLLFRRLIRSLTLHLLLAAWGILNSTPGFAQVGISECESTAGLSVADFDLCAAFQVIDDLFLCNLDSVLFFVDPAMTINDSIGMCRAAGDTLSFSSPTDTVYFMAFCVDTMNGFLALNVDPLPDVSPSASSVCAGDSVIFAFSGITSFTLYTSQGIVSGNFLDTVLYLGSDLVLDSLVDGNTCSAILGDSIEVIELPTLELSRTSICSGDSVLMVFGGTGPWVLDTGLSVTYSADSIYLSPTASTYIFSLSDATGCSLDTMVEIEVNALPTILFSDSLACGNDNWSILLTGDSIWMLYWNVLSSQLPDSAFSQVISLNGFSTDTVVSLRVDSLKDATGCVAFPDFSESITFTPGPLSDNVVPAVCVDDSLVISGLVNADSLIYQWLSVGGTDTLLGLPDGSTVKLFVPVAADTLLTYLASDEGCVQVDTLIVTEVSFPQVQILSDSVPGDGADYCIGQGLQFTAVGQGSSGYTWNVPTGVTGSGTFSPVLQIPDITGVVNGYVTLTQWNTDVDSLVRCEDSDSIPLVAVNETCVFEGVYQFPGGIFVAVLNSSANSSVYAWTDGMGMPIVGADSNAILTFLPGALVPDMINVSASFYSDFTCACQSGILDVQNILGQEERQVLAYPNPTRTELNLLIPSFLTEGWVTLRLFSYDGSIVFEQDFLPNERLLMVRLPEKLSGVYSLELRSNDYLFTDKLFVR